MNSCQGCEKRRVGCHGTCEDYAQRDAENKQRRKQIREESEYRGYCIAGIYKYKRAVHINRWR